MPEFNILPLPYKNQSNHYTTALLLPDISYFPLMHLDNHPLLRLLHTIKLYLYGEENAVYHHLDDENEWTLYLQGNHVDITFHMTDSQGQPYEVKMQSSMHPDILCRKIIQELNENLAIWMNLLYQGNDYITTQYHTFLVKLQTLINKNPMDIQSGIFISYWDSGAAFRAPCSIHSETKQVFDIFNAGHPSDDDCLHCETVEIDGQEYDVENIDEILEFCDLEEAYNQLKQLQDTNGYWYSPTDKQLCKELLLLTKDITNTTQT